MEETNYEALDDTHLLALCIWREARGEGMLGRRGVGCVVRNRVNAGWLRNDTYQGVILHPYQFSSFNAPPRTHISDANESLWPLDGDVNWMGCLAEANDVLAGCDDVTNGAMFYYSPPLSAPPKAWGPVVATASIGRLAFWKPAPADLSMTGDV